MGTYDQEIDRAAFFLSRSQYAVASCGAGFSAESNIMTFRDPGGLWDQVDPAEVGTVDGLLHTIETKGEVLLNLLHGLLDTFEKAEPNPGHLALAALEQKRIVKHVITQNVDNLHQEAGSTNVTEVHGNLFRMRCLSCHQKHTPDRKGFIGEMRAKMSSLPRLDLNSILSLAPPCDRCGEITRPDVVMFGESVQDLPQAFQVARECDVMLVLGTSGVVYPAAYFPIEAKNAGARIIVINPNENAFKPYTDVYLPMRTGEALPAIVEALERRGA